MAISRYLACALAGSLATMAVLYLLAPGYLRSAPEQEAGPDSEQINCPGYSQVREDRLRAEISRLRDQLAHSETAVPGTACKQESPAMIPTFVDESPKGREYSFEGEFSEMFISERALLSLGLQQYQVEELRAAVNAHELAKLEARAQAEETGLSTSSRLTAELRDLEQDFRQTVGEENYDRILYASGEKNRLKVGDTLADSPATSIGLMQGDIIYSYGGERIFDPSTFYLKARDTPASISVDLVVERAGEQVYLSSPGGQLGAKMIHIRRQPGE